MAVPKRKHCNSRTGKRRSQDAKTPPQIEYCAQCAKVVPSHSVCPNCGHYMGRRVVKVES